MATSHDPGSSTADDELNDAERALLKAAATGDLVVIWTGDADLDSPTSASDWDDDRNVRAEFLANLLTGDQPPSTGSLRPVKLQGARITGALNLEARKLLCPVLLRDCYFDAPINLMEAEAASIRLPGCHVPGLNANQLRVVGSVEFSTGFASRGEIQLIGAHISGVLDLSEASLANNNGPALTADSLTTGQDMLCDGLTAQGETRLLGAHVGGQLVLSEASLANNNGPALTADFITVDGSMFCADGFTTQGETRLPCAHISGVLDLSEASLANNNGPALTADSLTTGQDMLCDGLTAQGETRLPRAHISGQLSFRRATLTSNKGPALTARSLIVDGDMHCLDGFTAHREVDMTHARVGTLYDDPDGWPDVLRLNGFSYGGLRNGSVSVRRRLEWLQRHPGRFTPGIYDRLADVYRRAGHDGAARKISVTKQWRRRKPYNLLRYLWWVTVGYGYRTWQAFVWAAALTLAGALIFWTAYPAHMVALTAHPPRFQPVIYALDVLLPIGGLGQKSAWQPTGGYLDWYWAFAIAGWVLSAAVVAGLTGILKRD